MNKNRMEIQSNRKITKDWNTLRNLPQVFVNANALTDICFIIAFMNDIKITFYGGVETVTGSKHLIETPNGYRILLDCGLFQGKSEKDPNRQFGFDPRTIDCLILTHAHVDHCGLIPKLVKEGFKGYIYCTPPTLELTKIMLEDSAKIQELDIEFVNKRRYKKGLKPLSPIYTIEDAKACFDYFYEVNYHEFFKINDEMDLYFTDAGHIIGSACVNLYHRKDSPQEFRITYTGDIGRAVDKILKSPETLPNPHVLICESTYGDKTHRPSQDSILFDIVHETCVQNKGKLIIPAFSVDRTQEIIYALDRLKNQGLLSRIPVYVDSPLSIKATYIMKRFSEYFNQNIKEYMQKTDGDAFHFENLYYVTERSDSKKLNEAQGPMIIISASGMAEAGPVKHHIMHSIENPRNTILFSGHCTPESLGGKLIAGHKEVIIFGERHKVNARIEKIEGYSAHADKMEILEFLSPLDKSLLQQIFLVHGETETAEVFQAFLIKNGFRNVTVPKLKQSFWV